MRVLLAQLDVVLGDVAANVERAVEVLGAARRDGADLVVFPELFLTGAAIGEVEDDLGMTLDDPRLGRVVAATADGPAACVGFVQAGRRANFYNSAVYAEAGCIRHVHHKAYLVTYHRFEEGKYFTPGGAMRAYDAAAGRFATLICNDAWQPPLVFIAVEDGAQVLLIPSNSGESDFDAVADTHAYWRQITQFYASLFQCYVVFVNRVGDEAGMRFWGGSHVVDPWGAVVQEAPAYDEAQLSVELDLTRVRRRRREVPFLKESRLGLLSKELTRLVNESAE